MNLRRSPAARNPRTRGAFAVGSAALLLAVAACDRGTGSGPQTQTVRSSDRASASAPAGTAGTLGIAANGLPPSSGDRGAGREPSDRSAASTATAASSAAGVDPHDRDFLVQAAAAGMFELQVAQLAASRAASSEARALAAMLVNDHTNADNELAQLATVRGVALPTRLPQDFQAQLRKLSQASGPRFDREFAKVGIGAHEKDIRRFEEAARDTQDPQIKAWIDRTLTALHQHLSEARKLEARG